MDWLFTVWSTASVIAAIGGGVGLGAFLVLVPQAAAATRPTPGDLRRLGAVVAAFLAWAGTVFYAGQVAEAWLTGDAGVPRIVSRFLLWIVFSVAVAAGVVATLRLRGER